MAFLTTPEFRNKFNIGQNAFAAQITSAAALAALSIREVVDTDVYAEATGAALDADDDNYVRQQKVIQAQAYLTYYFLLSDAGLKLSQDGVVKEAQDAKSVEGGVITNKYLTPAEIERLKADALDKAKFWLSDYGTLLIGEEISEQMQETIVSTLKYF